MYNLIKYSTNSSKTPRGLRQYCKEDPNDNITDSESFKTIITERTSATSNTKDIEIAVPVTHLNNFLGRNATN